MLSLPPRLTYPIEQPYRIPRVTGVFYAGSEALIILLAVLNLALVGYEPVTVLINDPNVTYYPQWWAPQALPKALRIRTKPGECLETRLPLNTPLRTNSTLPIFQYVLANNFDLSNAQGGQAGLRRETPYKANPLDSCRVQDMTFIGDLQYFSFMISTNVHCLPTGNLPQILDFAMSFSSGDKLGIHSDSILEYLAYQARNDSSGMRRTTITTATALNSPGSLNNTFFNVLGVLDALRSDTLVAMMTVKAWSDSAPEAPKPLELLSLLWDSQDDADDHNHGILSQEYFEKGIFETVTNHNLTSSTTPAILNMCLAIRDAIHLDLGYGGSANIYLNKSSFDKRILPNNPVEDLRSIVNKLDLSQVYRIRQCTWGWGCTPNENLTWAETLTSSDKPVNNITIPISPEYPIHPLVIDTAYLCPQYQRKSWGSLLILVFVGTFTMYSALYSIFTWLGPQLNRRLRGPQPWERHDPDLEHADSGPQPPDFVATPYYPEFEYAPKENLLGGFIETWIGRVHTPTSGTPPPQLQL